MGVVLGIWTGSDVSWVYGMTVEQLATQLSNKNKEEKKVVWEFVWWEKDGISLCGVVHWPY